MPRVFISNTKIQETENADIIFITSKGIEQLQQVDVTGRITYVIDVHCIFTYNKKQLKQQEQGGVIIYRHLLKQFEKCQDKLKVIFYSPISKEHLVALKPENYVLTLLPFVECKYEGKEEFEAVLKEAEQKVFPLFNNASENLLSGWALSEKQTVQTNFLSKEESEKPLNEQTPKKRSIAIIDDQLNEWETTFRKVFEPKSELRFLHYDRSQGTPNKFEKSKIVKLDQVKDVDLVLSDFYLEEPHESNNWMSSEQLASKSGFQLFEAIKGRKGERGINKGVPYVMHTSSNKIQYYKFLEANGVDNWLIKDTRPDTPNQQKQENYFAFKREIETYTSDEISELYDALREIWKKIEIIENWAMPLSWWDSRDKKGMVVSLVKNSWVAIRSFAQRESYVVDNIGSVDMNFTPAAIISNVGKILEKDFYSDFESVFDKNYCFHFLRQVRNSASHYIDYTNIVIADALIYLEVLLALLENTKVTSARKIFKPIGVKEFMIQDNGSKSETFKYRILYVYLQYFNSPYSKDAHSAKMRIKKRVNALLQDADKNILLKEILNHRMPVDDFGKEQIGAIHLSKSIAQDLINNPSLDFSIIEEKGKLFIINE